MRTVFLALALAIASVASAGLEGRLRGTLVAGERGAAVFAGEDGRQRLFWVGQEVEGAVVSKVEPGKVLVTQGDASRWLYLPDAAVSAGPWLAAEEKPQVGGASAGPEAAWLPPEASPAATVLDNTGKKLGRAAMERLLGVSLPEGSGFDPVEYLAKAASSDIIPEEGLYQLANSVLRTMKVASYEENGQPAGVQLDLVMPGSPAAGLGFVGGDVIVAIDGHEVRSLRDAVRLYPVIAGRSQIKVDYLRGGRRESKVVYLK